MLNLILKSKRPLIIFLKIVHLPTDFPVPIQWEDEGSGLILPGSKDGAIVAYSIDLGEHFTHISSRKDLECRDFARAVKKGTCVLRLMDGTIVVREDDPEPKDDEDFEAQKEANKEEHRRKYRQKQKEIEDKTRFVLPVTLKLQSKDAADLSVFCEQSDFTDVQTAVRFDARDEGGFEFWITDAEGEKLPYATKVLPSMTVDQGNIDVFNTLRMPFQSFKEAITLSTDEDGTATIRMLL